jgi:hypothetical protein
MARDEKDGSKERTLQEKIENAVEQNKRDFWAQQLEKDNWNEVKSTKKGFIPKHTRIKHLDGRVARSDERPDILADHFEQVQWAE